MERRGIDIVFKASKKRYPFLVDWDFELTEYSTIAPISLRINQDMICEHYGYEKITKYGNLFDNFSHIMDCDVNTGGELFKEIRYFFETGYTMVPVEYCIMNELWKTDIKKLSVGLCSLIL
jgi:hypothetical protein